MKQETLEEAAERLIFKTIGGNYGIMSSDEHDQTDGYFNTYKEAFLTLKLKWQADRMYSEEDLRNAYRWGTTVNHGTKEHFNELFEQFKKK
jgi:hypothetical protein